MKIDIKKDIIIPAWELIKDDGKVKKMYFLPGLLSIIFLSALLVYQIIYTYVVLFGKKKEIFETILNFIHSNFILEFIIGAVIFIILYIFIIPIFEGGLIRYIYVKDKTSQSEISESLNIGLNKFLYIFNFNNLFSEFKLLSILNFYLFILRFFEFQYINYINNFFLFALIFSIIINIIFIYTKYIIIIENKNVFYSMGKSIKISLMNLKNTIRLYFLMFILNIRVIFNLLVFLIFPIIIVIVVGIISTKIIQTLVLFMIIGVFILFILFLGYLTGVLEILKTSIWFYAYKTGKQRLENAENIHKRE